MPLETDLARPPQTNEAFFREVDDEVRRERMTRMARRYGVIAVAVVVLALLAFGGWLLWRNHVEARAGERGEALTAAIAAVSAGNKDAARAKLDPLARDGGPTYGALARLTLADVQVQAGQPPQAVAAFMKVADDAAVPEPLRDLARIRATALAFDRLPPADIVNRMKPLAVPGGPWAGSAGELIGLAQLRAGQRAEAAKSFAAVARDTAVPDTLRERARQLAGDLGIAVETAPSPHAIVR